jgi:hypothetical protein
MTLPVELAWEQQCLLTAYSPLRNISTGLFSCPRPTQTTLLCGMEHTRRFLVTLLAHAHGYRRCR